MSNDYDEDVSILDDIAVAECNDDTMIIAECNRNMPKEMDHKSDVEQVNRSECRDPVTGKFTKGWKGGGRPVGSKDRFSKRVLDTLEACWEANADSMLAQLAAEKPEVIMGMVAKLMPQNLITEDITGESQSNQGHSDVTIRIVSQAAEQSVLPAREVQGELLPSIDDTSVH